MSARIEYFTTADGRRALRYLEDDTERGIAAGSEFLIVSHGYGASTLTPLEAREVYVSDEGDQGYGEWLESIEDGVSATLRARHLAICLLCERETVPAHGDTCPECDAWLNERREALGIEL